MLTAQNTSLICPVNDLESKTIVEIARAEGLDVHAIQGAWGVKLEAALAQIDSAALRDEVIIVELPAQAASTLSALRDAGKTIHIVDHHHYNHQSASDYSPSSLEQFANKMGYTLKPEEWEIAINDRDFFPGLSQAGVKWERVCALRAQEWAIRGQTETMDRVKKQLGEYVRALDDLNLALVPESDGKVMLEAMQTPEEKDYNEACGARQPVSLKPVLVLQHQDGDAHEIVQIEFAGGADAKAWINALREEPQWQADFELWSGGGRFGCFFGAKPKHAGADIDGLVSRLLSMSLHTGRPLRHYGCTFLLPLDLFLDDELKQNDPQLKLQVNAPQPAKPQYVYTPQAVLQPIDADKATTGNVEKEAYLYFLPHLRDSIYDTNEADSQSRRLEQPIRHWQLQFEELGQWQIVDKSHTINAQLQSVSLYEYFNQQYMLGLSVAADNSALDETSLVRDDTSWWHELFFCSLEQFKQLAQLQLIHWLRFTNQARIIYPSYAEQVFEGKLAVQHLDINGTTHIFDRCQSFSPILRNLITAFFKPNKQWEERLKYLPEDRMFAIPAYGLTGLPPRNEREQERLERLFSLALYVDDKSGIFSDLQGYAYDVDFTKDLLNKHTLKRWAGLGTYSGYYSYANAHLGFGWFFNNVIAPTHVPHHYTRMMVLALFYQSTLRHFNRRISYATEQLANGGSNTAFRDLRRDFILFTNNYWFREVTSQVQGVEIFTRQTEALGLEQEYQLIKDEVERADEYSGLLWSENINRVVVVLTVTAIAIGVLAVDKEFTWPETIWPISPLGAAAIIGGLGIIYVLGHRFLRRAKKRLN